MRFVLLAFATLLAGCVGTSMQNTSHMSFQAKSAANAVGSIGAHDEIVAQIKRAATTMCKTERTGRAAVRCQFSVSFAGVDESRPMASSRVDVSGNTRIFVNQTMLSRIRNSDELAFVVAHEAAHTIAGHHSGFHATQLTGGFSLSKQRAKPQIELEADALATIISRRAGFDPIRGVRILKQLGNHARLASATHPALAARTAIVQKTDRLIQQGWEIEID